MKLVLSVLVLVVAQVAFAMPRAQDSATFKGLFQGGGGGSVEFTQKLDLLSVGSEKSKIRSTVNISGRPPQVQEVEVETQDLPTTEWVNQVLAQCSSMGGSPEKITVPAGTFDTCSAAQENGGRVWITLVPFAVVKQIMVDEDKNVTTLELATFAFGQ